MADPLHNSGTSRKSEVTTVLNRKDVYKKNVVASGAKAFPQSAYKCIAKSIRLSSSGSGAVGQVAMFLLKVAALEAVRRVSRSKCPPVWRGIQALQILCCPPFKWIQRWAPFKGLVKGVQVCSCSCYNHTRLLLFYQLLHMYKVVDFHHNLFKGFKSMRVYLYFHHN